MTSENISDGPLSTSVFDDFLDATFDASDEEIEASIAREAEELKAVCVELEEAFPETGLRFTESFRGLMPVTAYGWILGKRFYFRFRADTATLTVGTVDSSKAEAEFERRIAMHAQGEAQLSHWKKENVKDIRIAPVTVTAEMREAVIDRYNLAIETDFAVAAFPNDVAQRVSILEYTGHKWNGVLTPAQAKDAFTQLVLKLEK